MSESTTKYEVPGYAKVCGILALILAIVSMIVPIFGVILITPLAIVLGAAALYGNYKGMGIATIIIVVINLIISPTFWANVGLGANMASATINRLLTYFDVIGVIVMLFLAARKNK